MRNVGVKGLLGVLAGVALLAGCGQNGGRLWSLTAQEDYYSEQAQSEVGKERSNLVTSATAFETNEQERGTGGAGESPGGQGNIFPGSPVNEQERASLWQRQDERVPFPPARFDALVAQAIGTGKPLKKGRNGAWIQGTHALELGSGVATTIAPSSASYQPQESMGGGEAMPPQVPTAGSGGGYVPPR